MSTLKAQNTSFFTLVIAFVMVVAGCKKEDDSPIVTTQEKIDTVVDSVRLAVETDIGKTVPTLNVFIQTPEGS